MKLIILLMAAVSCLLLCNQKSEKEKRCTLVKICSYNCDSVLNCNTHLFTRFDHHTIDSLKSSELYINRNIESLDIAKMQKDTVVLLVK